jgi:2-isopropylmalate synthase
MAVANSLAGVLNGARQIECTINGLGERAGNTSLEEVVMAAKTRRDFFGLDVGIDTTQIVATSKLVSNITGFAVQPNKAVVGANAFAHASGIHQDGVLKARQTYEIMRAEDVGWAANKIVLGKLSGRNAFKQRVQELGIPVEGETELNAAFTMFKELADRKAEIYDEDIQALFSDETLTPHDEHFKLVSLAQHSETGARPHARVVMNVRVGRQRPGRCIAQGDRAGSQQRVGTAALFGQCHHHRNRVAGRGHRAAGPGRAHRQRRGGRS